MTTMGERAASIPYEIKQPLAARVFFHGLGAVAGCHIDFGFNSRV